MTDLLTEKDTVYYTDFLLPDSSFVENLVYDAQSATLYVQIDGVIYEYDGVSDDEWTAFTLAGSTGSQYHKFATGRRSSDRLDAADTIFELREVVNEEDGTVTSDTADVFQLITGENQSEEGYEIPGVLEAITGDLEDLVERQSRQVALGAAAVIFQSKGNKADVLDVLYAAATFEQYLADGSIG